MTSKTSIAELKKICHSSEKDKNSYLAPLNRFFSIRITRLLINTKITANQVSAMSIFLGVGGSLLLTLGTLPFYLASALILFFFVVFDHVDGEIARYRIFASKKPPTHSEAGSLGQYCELMQHQIVLPCFLACLSFGLFLSGSGLSVFILGFIAISSFMLYHVVSFFSIESTIIDPFESIMTINNVEQVSNTHRIMKIIQKLLFNILNSSFIPFMVLACSLLGILYFSLLCYAVAYFVLAVSSSYFNFQQFRKLSI